MDMDVERTMQFILSQQAQFVNGMQALGEKDAFLEKQIQDLAQAQFRQLETVNRVIDTVDRLGHRVDDLAVAQRRTEENLNRVEENLNALIKVVDGIVRRGQ